MKILNAPGLAILAVSSCTGLLTLHAGQQMPMAAREFLFSDGGGDPVATMWFDDGGDNKRDPAYKIYKEGYDLVLDERWEEARKKLREVAKTYPKSEYVDDAEYWSAYALMHIDKKKAAESYERFIQRFPKSQYYDDAVADLSDLKGGAFVRATSSASGPSVATSSSSRMYTTDSTGAHWTVFTHPADGSPSESMGPTPKTGRGVPKPGSWNGKTLFGYRFKYGTAPAARQLSQALRLQSRTLNAIRLPRTLVGTPVPMPEMAPGWNDRDDDLDQETRLKMEALEELGSGKQDSTAFRALRDIVLDRSQNPRLRMAAMEGLVDFKKYDVLPVFLEAAKKDTSQEIQNAAIDNIGMLTNDKNRSVETLIELFDVIPRSRNDQRENVFYSIAEVGNERAVDFLAKVARTHENYDLRREAVYYLGSIGSDHARAALYEILQGK
jgi:tetratricopeptide (TPR) repeat protein